MPAASIAAGHQEPYGQGDTPKYMVNGFPVYDRSQIGRDMTIRRPPGVDDADVGNVITTKVRGLAQADGFASGALLVSDGATVRKYATTTAVWSAFSGALAGDDRTQWAFSQEQAAVLAGGRIYLSNSGATELRDITDGMRSEATLAIGSTTTAVAHAAFTYRINGTNYTKAGNTAGIAPGSDVIPVDKYGAVAFDINAAGAITVVAAAANATGYDTASEAIAGIPAVAIDHVRVGTVTAMRDAGAFTFGTTALDDADSTVEYVDGRVNTGFTDLLEAAGATGFSSIASMGQRLMFTYGDEFGFSDVLDFGATTALNYYTAEQNPDTVIAGVVVGQLYYLIGTAYIEFWAQASNVDSPFYPYQGASMNIGCKARDTIVRLDEALVMVCHDGSVRRIIAGSDQVLSIKDSWVSDTIDSVDASTLYAFGEGRRSDLLYVIGSPEWCYGLSVGTSNADDMRWHRRRTVQREDYRWGHACAVGGAIYYGGRDGTEFGLQSRTTYRDYGDENVVEFTAHLPELPPGMAIGPVILGMVTGVGIVSGQGSDPVVSMRISIDGGNTWGPWMDRQMGAMGQYGTRPRWNQCGSARYRNVVLHFRVSDPVNVAAYKVEFAA